MAPTIVELDSARELIEEVFGPVLHVMRWRADEFDQLLDDIAANGTALTLGIHSRIETTVARIAESAAKRQCLCEPQHDRGCCRITTVRRQRPVRYRAEGWWPNYLHRFAIEQVVTVNTAASGGNATFYRKASRGDCDDTPLEGIRPHSCAERPSLDPFHALIARITVVAARYRALAAAVTCVNRFWA